jgi:hypothetical protein
MTADVGGAGGLRFLGHQPTLIRVRVHGMALVVALTGALGIGIAPAGSRETLSERCNQWLQRRRLAELVGQLFRRHQQVLSAPDATTSGNLFELPLACHLGLPTFSTCV